MKKKKPILLGNRDGMWALIRKLETFTMRNIVTTLGMGEPAVRTYIGMLMRGGYVERVVPKPKPGVIFYRLVKDIGYHKPELAKDGTRLPPTGQQRMWVAMKVLKMFSYLDISLTAQVPHSTARTYCTCLARAGYLVKWKHNSSRFSYDQKRDTGPQAPRVRARTIYDVNLQRVVWPESEAT